MKNFKLVIYFIVFGVKGLNEYFVFTLL